MAVSEVQKPSMSVSRCAYHVFLSFRGIDTRKNFTDYLYMALMQVGIHTFRDDENIEKGKNIKDEIEKAILHESKISIIVFSKDYASSTWCLNELVKIMEHKKSSQHIVLPVFYKVDPLQIKKQTGSYAEAFAKHEESFRSEMDMVRRWRAALKEAADLAGMVLQDRHESQFIQDIVKQVQSKLHQNALYVPPYLVGIDSLVTRINWWLEEDGSNKVGIALICGIGGIGKTTVAKVVYNQNIQRFEGCSFLSDVRETCEECNGFVHLQRQLITDIFKGKAHKVYNADNGINMIKEAICCRRVLLVLDDVDDLEIITKLFGLRIHFHPGSKIIITSRHLCLLSAPFISQIFDLGTSSGYGNLSKLFEVKELAFNESLQLFNWYAFGHNSITESFMEYTSNIVKHCGGLPLALQVLGSFLSGKSISVWKSALEKLEAIPDSKIQKILRISYDSLEDDHDKNLFLDIACLFIGRDRDYTTTILDGCDFYTTIGIENLIGRSFITVDEKNKLKMHQMIRDMGKEIIRQESPNLGKRSRLWHQDAFDVIREKIGSKAIKCLSLDLQRLLEDKSRRTPSSLSFPEHSKSRYVMSDKVGMETQAFAKMQGLKLLQLDYLKLKGDFEDFPKGLIWLHWHGFPMQSLPTDFDIRRLVVLDMRNSNLKTVWKDKECLPNLKILSLNHSHSLLKTPNFSGLPSLEKLMLKDCIKLIEVDLSIGELKMLTLLNLKDCKSLRKLPRTIGSLISLEELILSGCSRLDDVPKELHNMKSLRVLSLDEIAMNQTRLWLPWLSMERRKELGFFWASLPCSLVKLSVESCRLSDDVMPNDFCNLVSLKSLNLSRNPIRCLPESIGNLTKLDELVLASCTKLEVIPKLPMLSNFVKVFKSLAPLTVSLTNLCLFYSNRCVIFGCERLTEVQDLFKLEPIENFEAAQIERLFNMDSVDNNKVQLYNYLTDKRMVATPQILQESGIISTFVLGSEVPTWLEHRTKGPRISFSLPAPSHPNEKISWFSLCIVFSVISDQILELLPRVCICNETKEIIRTYDSSFIGIPESNNNTMLWLLHWPATGFQFEGGDFVSCTVMPFHLNIREFGVTYQLENNIGHEYGFPHYFPGNEDVFGNFKLEVTEGIVSLNCDENIKVEICNNLKESKMIASPQVLYDCGIITVYDPIPSDYCGNQVGRPKTSITAPSKSSPKTTCWLKSIVVLSANNSNNTFELLPRVEIVNETKGTKWTYSKHFIGIPETKNTLYWLTNWKFGGDELEAGDHITLRVLSDLRVIESSIDLVYDHEPDDKSNYILHQWLGITKCSSYLSQSFVYLSFKSSKTLYRMQSSIGLNCNKSKFSGPTWLD